MELVLNGARPERPNGRSKPFLEVGADSVLDRRRQVENGGFAWMMVRLAILAAGAAGWFRLYHGQLGVHR